MWNFIRDLPTDTRGQRVIQALVLLLAIGSMVYLFRDVPAIIRNTDWRVSKPHFDEGRIENGRYINDFIGWEIAIPEGWELGYTRSESQNRYAVGVMKEYGATDSLIGRTKELVTFNRGRLNTFRSSVEPADGMSEVDLLERELAELSLFEEQFSQMGMDVESGYPQREIVGGKVFYASTMEITVRGRQTKIGMTSYGGIIGGRYLGVVMSYSDPKYKFELLNAWRRSVFHDR
jgi:hypothetical protein